MTKKKESLGLKASKIISVVNALWRKKAMLQMICSYKYCLAGEAVQWASCFQYKLLTFYNHAEPLHGIGTQANPLTTKQDESFHVFS